MRVFLGIGSNLGDRAKNCLKAIDALNAAGIRIVKTSSMYETKPWGFKQQPDFINMAVEAETVLSPMELLSRVKEIERAMGRNSTERWGPRIIDIDILLYEDKIIQNSSLCIPHPYMHEREFVLKPLAEIAPHLRHPRMGRTVLELLQELLGK